MDLGVYDESDEDDVEKMDAVTVWDTTQDKNGTEFEVDVELGHFQLDPNGAQTCIEEEDLNNEVRGVII